MPLLEKRADERWGSEPAYQAYKKETYSFFLLPTRRTEASVSVARNDEAPAPMM